MITENLTNVKQKIADHCNKVGRSPEEVKLIAVSKTKPINMLKEAIEAGATDFGENKVQEIRDKFDALGSAVQWHMIGHLQTNKVKYIIDKVSLIHSVDSLRLAQEIEKQAKKHHVTAHVLIQINVAEEESKFGVATQDTEKLVREIAQLPHVKIDGLMTIAPYVVDSEENRPIFRRMKEIFIDIASKNIDNVSMKILSMGMTGDFGVAIEEGSTMVRVGTGIFGQRNYNK